jgi:hemerythrin
MPKVLVWQEPYAVGHHGLDDEHRAILKAINAICAADIAKCDSHELCGLCDSLKATAKNHFGHENLVLDAIVQYTGREPNLPVFIRTMSESVISEHLASHGQALDELDSLIQVASSSTRPEGPSLRDGLKRWFVVHAVKYDAHLKAIFQAMENDCPALIRKLH